MLSLFCGCPWLGLKYLPCPILSTPQPPSRQIPCNRHLQAAHQGILQVVAMYWSRAPSSATTWQGPADWAHSCCRPVSTMRFGSTTKTISKRRANVMQNLMVHRADKLQRCEGQFAHFPRQWSERRGDTQRHIQAVHVKTSHQSLAGSLLVP